MVEHVDGIVHYLNLTPSYAISSVVSFGRIVFFLIEAPEAANTYNQQSSIRDVYWDIESW